MTSSIHLQSFTVKKWAALVPSQDNTVLQEASIPTALKRRLSHLSKMALSVSGQVTANDAINYAVFCSQHGELNRTFSLLKTINEQEILSPTNFVGSVHNTAAGLFSIIYKIKKNMTSIAAGESTFLMGMIDALTWLQINPSDTVLLTIFDDDVPEIYHAFDIQSEYQYAVALLLTGNSTSTEDITISTQLKLVAANEDSTKPLAVEFIKWMLSNNNTLSQCAGQQAITWRKYFA